MITSEQVKSAARSLGFDLVGVAPAEKPAGYAHYRDWLAAGFHGDMAYMENHAALRSHPDTLLPGVRSIIAVGLNYYQPASWQPGNTKIARYAWGRDYHRVIRQKLRRLAADMGVGQFRVCVDSAPLLERENAHRAGLGWFGKNTMLINSQRGSWFLLGFLLTSIELEPDAPALGGCGTCRKCIEACPTGAIVRVDDRWQVDARRCISYLTIENPEHSDERIGDWTFGCDVCQEVCPFNEPRNSQPLRAQVTTEADFLRKTPLVDVPLSSIRTLSEAEWDAISAGSPIRRAGYSGLLRSAEINASQS